MPRVCSICHHLQHQAIDAALTAGEALRNIAQRFGTSTTALHRHKHEHLLGSLAHIQQSQTPASTAQDPQPMPQACTTPVQAPSRLSPEVVQALEAYRTALQEYAARQTPQPGRLPMDRTSILVVLQLRVERARQRLVTLGLDPQHLA